MKKFLLLILALCSLQLAAKNKIFSSNGIAIKGYDAVAFFNQNRAVKGEAKHQTQWENVNWYFSTLENLNLFKQSPEKYAPQFGGYCALGAAHLGAVPTNPRAFSIHAGKLYFNMTDEVRVTWKLNADFHIQRAEQAWKDNKITFYN